MVCLKIIRTAEFPSDCVYDLEFTLLQDKKVSFLKEYVAGLTKLSSSEINLIYGGSCLDEQRDISSYSIMSDSAVYVIKNPSVVADSDSSVVSSDYELESLSTSLKAAISDAQLRSLLIRTVTNTEGLSSLLASTSGLKDDLVAQGVLKDPYLFMHFLDSSNIRRTLEQHPAVIDAAQQILASVNEEGARRSGTQFADYAGMLADEYSDDEQANEDTEARQPGPSNAAQRPPITAEQLQMAFQQAARAGLVPNQQGNAGINRLSTVPPAQLPSAGRISASFLQQAILQASTSAQESKLQQLRDMGFIDDAENSRALNATAGNVEAALEWIINDRERHEQN